MTIKSIKGTLAPSNGLEITKHTASKINKAVSLSGLSEVIKPSPAWHHGIVVANLTSVKNDLTGFEFMSRLRELIHAKGVEELDLQGVLTIKTEDKKNPKNIKEFRVRVEAGTIASEEIKFSHLMNPEKRSLNHVTVMKDGNLMSVLSVLVTEGSVKQWAKQPQK